MRRLGLVWNPCRILVRLHLHRAHLPHHSPRQEPVQPAPSILFRCRSGEAFLVAAAAQAAAGAAVREGGDVGNGKAMGEVETWIRRPGRSCAAAPRRRCRPRPLPKDEEEEVNDDYLLLPSSRLRLCIYLKLLLQAFRAGGYSAPGTTSVSLPSIPSAVSSSIPICSSAPRRRRHLSAPLTLRPIEVERVRRRRSRSGERTGHRHHHPLLPPPVEHRRLARVGKEEGADSIHPLRIFPSSVAGAKSALGRGEGRTTGKENGVAGKEKEEHWEAEMAPPTAMGWEADTATWMREGGSERWLLHEWERKETCRQRNG